MADAYANERSGRILSAVIGGTVVHRDIPGAPPGTHDFDIVFGDQRTIAVETTISTDQAIVEFWHAVSRQSWDAPRLRPSWLLNVAAPTRVKGLQGQVEPLLERLERAGIPEFGSRRGGGCP